jgi:hypothetical protein
VAAACRGSDVIVIIVVIFVIVVGGGGGDKGGGGGLSASLVIFVLGAGVRLASSVGKDQPSYARHACHPQAFGVAGSAFAVHGWACSGRYRRVGGCSKEGLVRTQVLIVSGSVVDCK